MRAAFGLVAILVTTFILLYVWSKNAKEVTDLSKPAIKDAKQFSGYGQDDRRANETIKLDPFVVNGKVRYVLVDDITAGGAMEQFYGLKRNDMILAVGPLDLRDQDGEMAVDLIFQEGYQKKAEILIKRGGKEVKLPSGEVVRSDNPAPQTPAEKPVPSAGDHARAQEPAKTTTENIHQPRDTRSALQRQLDALPGTRRNE